MSEEPIANALEATPASSPPDTSPPAPSEISRVHVSAPPAPLSAEAEASHEGSAEDFRLSAEFRASEVFGAIGLGPLELHYEELFAEALEDGVITADERERLDKAADNLGLDRPRLRRLEAAMLAAYHARHRVAVIERYQNPPASLTPLLPDAPALSTDATHLDGASAALVAELTRLRARVAELEEELRRAQAAINVEVDLGPLDSAIAASAGDASQDPDDQWKLVRRDPTDPEALRQLRDIYAARGDLDAEWCAAQALVALGLEEEDEAELHERHRHSGLIAPLSAITQATWQDCLFHPEEEPLTGQIFSLIAPAVLIGRVTTLRRDGSLHVASAATAHVPDDSTVSAVRALGWGAALLGLPTPRIHVERARADTYLHVPGVPPYTVVGQAALQGRTQTELAFLAGRHLCGYRSEHFVTTLFSAVPDLEDLFLSALVIGRPNLPVSSHVRQRVEPIARAIEPLLEPAAVDALRGHFMRFVEEGGRTNLQRWAQAVAKTQCRVGLALSQDLPSALAVLQAEEGARGPLARDLIAFSTSARFLRLRKRLGIALA